MVDKIHAHILDELKIITKSDTKFIITAIILNFLTLIINLIYAVQGEDFVLIMLTFVILTITVSVVAEVGLIRGRKARKKLIMGLIQMYTDHGVEQYYDLSLLDDYKHRYNLFILVIMLTGLVSSVVPFFQL